MIYIANRKTGAIRTVGEGVEMKFEPDEYVVIGGLNQGQDNKPDLLTRLAAKLGIAVSDLIESAAKALDETGQFGDTFKQCSRCQLRAKVLHAIEHLGLWPSIRIITKTILKRDLTGTELTALDKVFKE